jgi:hypothetical protein
MFLVGLDIGQAKDPSALVIVERTRGAAPDWPLKSPRPPAQYDDVVAMTADRMRKPPLEGASTLVLDYTGCGRPVATMFEKAKLRPINVSIHGGVQSERKAALEWTVAKRSLVAHIAVLLQQERLRFAAGLPLVDVLVQELLTFRQTIDPVTAHAGYSHWRERDHDDTVLALALAVWWGEEHTLDGPIVRYGTWG